MPQTENQDVARYITAYEGTTFAVSLENNPSTGYSWALTGMPQDNVLGLVGVASMPPQTPMPGAPGSLVFTFLAFKKPGEEERTETLRFKLLRSWLPQESAGQTINVEVRILPADKIGSDAFVEYEQDSGRAAVRMRSSTGGGTVIAYGFPDGGSGSGSSNGPSTAVSPCFVAYGVPGGPIPAGMPGSAPPSYGNAYQTVPQSAGLLYGYFPPDGPVPAGVPCSGPSSYQYAYQAAPQTPGLMYGYYGCVDTSSPPLLKYGYPGCVDPSQPTVKYGYYGCRG